MAKAKGKILVVGLCCVDEVAYVDKFPLEDSDNRVFERDVHLGGNAANSVTVLRQLNTNSQLFATMPHCDYLLEKVIKESGIDISLCIRKPDGYDCPITNAIVNRQTGTRTILHYRGNLPEFTCEEFVRVFDEEKLKEYRRNCDAVKEMLTYVRAIRKDAKYPRLSVELEKIRPFPMLEQLILLPDLLFLSKDFSRHKGWLSMEEAIHGIQNDFNARNTTVIVPWAELGSCGRESIHSDMIRQPVVLTCQNTKIIDTLAAGDCYIGAALHYLNEEKPLDEVLRFATQTASNKCCKKGLLNLKLDI